MNVIVNLDYRTFSLNGEKYLKNYITRPAGDRLMIFNCYDNRDVLVELQMYDQFNVDGITYDNVTDLQSALLDVTYVRSFDSTSVPAASDTVAGIARLYQNVTGNNTDGAPAQKAVKDALALKLPIETPSTTGTTISFDQDKIYGSISSPVSGNIGKNVTGAKLGVVVKMVHNQSTVPTFDSSFKKSNGSYDYAISVNNFITFEYWDNSNIIYSIHQL